MSVDTSNFYYDDEAELHEQNKNYRVLRRKLMNGYYLYPDGDKVRIKGSKEILQELDENGISEKQANQIVKEESFDKYDTHIRELLVLYGGVSQKIAECASGAKETKDKLLALLDERVEYNISHDEDSRHIRVLRPDSIKDEYGNIMDDNIISVFDSSFTRMIDAAPDSFCEDFLIVKCFYFGVLKDILYHGFDYNGERYIYFTSSAGQIRTKKCVFIKKSVYDAHEKTIMCGLTLKKINELGGNNPNKHLAYTALSSSATDEWEKFDIDKTIVIDDFETDVFGVYDFIDDVDYSITRKEGNVPVPHSDGCGMMLPDAFGVAQKNKMIRAPWIKGLLGVFDFRKFIEVNGCSPIVKDIYGVEHNVIDEDIQVILCKSQFKMWKYYESWSQYKEYFKQYNCSIGYTNEEEDRIKDATINYQMLQTLTDMTDAELMQIAKPSIDKLNNLCHSVGDVQAAFGATAYNTNKTAFQEAILIYPELLNDTYVKTKLKTIKDSLIKKYKAGKLQVNGKYTFVLPDLYAACEHWFMGVENPKGLLQGNDVFCWLFRKGEKLDCLRSPHLFLEHFVARNKAFYKDEEQDVFREWFQTDAIYTSSHSLISKVLQFDDL